jgi:hypothetical protein
MKSVHGFLTHYLDAVWGDCAWYRARRGGNWYPKYELDCWLAGYETWIRKD